MTDKEKILVCRECKREFKFSESEMEFYEQRGFTEPTRCPQCRKLRRETAAPKSCSRCGTRLDTAAPVFCSDCMKNIELEFEMKTGQIQQTANEAIASLESVETEKKELAELCQQKENLTKELELKIETLAQELGELNQMYATLNSWFQPTLNEMENRLTQKLEALELRHKEISEKMLQISRGMEEIQDAQQNISLMEAIKCRMRGYQRRNTQTT